MQLLDLKHFIFLDGEEIPLDGSLTIGRHLDNDVVVAGEDVLDYHLRVEPTSRGLKVYPLGEASLKLNDQNYSETRGLVIGDVLLVGQSELVVIAKPVNPPQADEWWLYGEGERNVHRVVAEMVIGRGEDSDLLLLDDHVSRSHARLLRDCEVVWLQDLDSANGTFVNGERLAGGCRLYHGDYLAFDTVQFQLVGKGTDLTPVRHDEPPEKPALIKDDPGDRDTTEIAVVSDGDDVVGVLAPPGERGAFLLGAGEPVSGVTFRTGMGRTTVGRDEDCDIVIRDSTVSSRHAEIIVRPEGCTITNLMATNGTRVNGQEVQSAQLNDGDVVRLGRVRLVFKDVSDVEQHNRLARLQGWMMAGSLIVVAVLVWLLVLAL
ncbi:MAG: FHA domain-containing protein [Gammaproteobacteria bacterium]|nr:FHA domain-containing protein [Gammaproteobacteria bacterium]